MIYSIGEAFIDMIPSGGGKSLRNATAFSKQAGGAPANVAAVVAKLGGKSAFIGKVGKDGFGQYIVDVLKESNVDISCIKFSNKLTGIIYIALNEDGDREFISQRNDSADLYLSEDEIDCDMFKKNDILHFCSVSLVESPVKYAHIKALNAIINNGGRVSFDVNLRLMLWRSKEECLNAVWDFIQYPDYLKVSNDEVETLFNSRDYDYAARTFFNKGSRLRLLIISMGSNGSILYMRNGNKYSIPAIKSKVVDTTGAGDSFIGSILYQLDIIDNEPNDNEMLEIIRFATFAASIQVQRQGAITSLPTKEEVIKLMSDYK